MNLLDWFRRTVPEPPPVDTGRRLRQLEVIASRLVRQGFSGQYHAAFHGRGIEFHQLRQYYPGDDIRTIDWNVTARSGVPYVREFIEERDLTILICLDVSGSMRFGSIDRRKVDVALELAAVFALAAHQNKDRIGLLAFGGEKIVALPPGTTRTHVDALIRIAMDAADEGGEDGGLEELGRHINAMGRRRAIVILLSDFIGDLEPLRKLAWRHELIALRLTDPREESLPEEGLARFRDLETGEAWTVSLGATEISTEFWRRSKDLQDSLRGMGIDVLDVSTARPYERDLVRFFGARSDPRRRRRVS